jgi:hypothetical protein
VAAADKRITFYEHPFFGSMQEAWEEYQDLYTGDHSTLVSPKYLWLHHFETASQGFIVDPATKQSESVGQRIRRIRAQRSRYLNMLEPIISNLISMAFTEEMNVDPSVTSLFGEDIENVDGKGSSLEAFIKGPLAIAYFRDGQPIVYVDAPSNPAISAGEEKQNGFRPFMEVLNVLEVPDWQVFDSGPNVGKYEWFRYEYEIVEKRSSPLQKPEEIEYCKVLSVEGGNVIARIYKEDEKSEDWAFVSEVVLSGWSEIPVSTCWTNESWVKDVAQLQLVLFNLMSAYYNQLNTQAFQRIFIAGDLGEKHQISISEYAVSQIPAEAKPYVIEPSNTQALVDGINATADQIYKVAFNRTRSLPASSNEAPSAETIQEMNAELVALLRQALEEMESVINSAIRHYAMFKLGPEKGSAFTGKVTFGKDIDVKAVADRLELYLAYKDDIRKVLPWKKAELKKAAVEMGYSEEDLLEIKDEIEALKAEPVIDPMMGLKPFLNQEDMDTEDGGPGQQDNQPAEPPSEAA